MAGDWIKMRADLLDDPAVIGIAAHTGLDEFAVVGRLQVLWSWADRQSRDGHANCVTTVWIDRKLQCDGFAQAMCAMGWLTVTEAGIVFPRFERHNGASAKARSESTQRKQRSRAIKSAAKSRPTPPAEPTLPGIDTYADVSHVLRDTSETREEERRDEENTHSGTSNTVARADDAVCVGFDVVVPRVGPELAHMATQAAQAMAVHGVQVAAGHPTLQALVAGGVTIEQLTEAARMAHDKGKGWEYAQGIVRNRYAEAHGIDAVTQVSRTVQGHVWSDTRSGIEAQGERLGLGRWDETAFNLGRGQVFSDYARQVRAAFEAEAALAGQGEPSVQSVNAAAR